MSWKTPESCQNNPRTIAPTKANAVKTQNICKPQIPAAIADSTVLIWDVLGERSDKNCAVLDLLPSDSIDLPAGSWDRWDGRGRCALQPPMPFLRRRGPKKRQPNSSPIDFTLFHDPLVGLAAALDPVLALTIPARKLAEHFVVAIDRVAIRKASAEADPLSRMVEMGGARLDLLVVCHDGTREAVAQSCPQLLQCQ
jgi:hypothetical protein